MSLKRNVLANYLGNGWGALMGLIFIPLYIKYMGMEAYGLIGVNSVLQAGLTLFDAGITPTLSREMSRFSGGVHSVQSIRDLLRSLEIVGSIIAFCFGFIIFCLSGWLAEHWLQATSLPKESVIQAFSIMGMVTALRLPEGLYRGAVLGLQKQVAFNVASAGLSTLRNLGAVLVLAFYSPTISAFFVWNGFVSLVAVVLFAGLTYGNLPEGPNHGQFSMHELRKVWRFAAGILSTSILVLILTQIDKLILSKILPLEIFGKYTFVATISNSLLIFISPITQAFYPRLTETFSQGNVASVKQIFHIGSKLVTSIIGTAACLIFCFSEHLIFIWTGNRELASTTEYLLKVMTLGTLLNGFMNMPYMLMLAFGKPGFVAKVNFVAVLFLAPATLLVTPTFGAVGAAFVWVILNAGYVFIAAKFMFRKTLTGEMHDWLANDILKPFVVSLISLVVFWFLKPDFASGLYDGIFIGAAGGVSALLSLNCVLDEGILKFFKKYLRMDKSI